MLVKRLKLFYGIENNIFFKGSGKILEKIIKR